MPYFSDRYANLRFPLAASPADRGLRSAQVAAAHALSAHFFGRRDSAIVIMPTGSGKTAVMILAAVVLRAARVLVLTPSRMVREQVAHHFGTLHVLRKAGALADDVPLPRVKQLAERPKSVVEWESLRETDVVVSTIQSVSPATPGAITRPADLFDLVLWDEAHHTPAPSWRALLEGFPSARHALFTATPFRRDGKLIKGRIVFDYPLGRAREDGVFGRLRFQPVATTAAEGSIEADLAIARATERQFDLDRNAGLDHRTMVRTSTRTRAEELAKLYEAKTKLRLRTIFGTHTRSHLLDIVDALKRGDLDGVICVDMLGEGFDLPSLKIAALHSPHKSLAVTLQFLGRFARTTDAPKTGEATFLAIPREIQSEAAGLYRVGAEWNEIVEEASRAKIDAEQEVRDVATSFAAVTASPPRLEDEPIDLASLWPFFHVKVLEVPAGVDFDRPLAVPVPEDIILFEKSDDHAAVVCITRHIEEARWSDDPRLSNVHHDLFVLSYDAASKLLFLCSSRREMGVYDALVQSIALGPERRLTPAELNRVLRGVENASFFSIGMRNRSGYGNGETYRITTGPAADRSVQKSDGRYYDRGHCFGKGDEGGTRITIGFSSASKVWANVNGRLHELFRWCGTLARKLSDATPVITGSNLDHLPLSHRAASIPDPLVCAAWGDEIYGRAGLRLHWTDAQGDEHELALLDASVEIVESTSSEAEIAVRGPGLDVRYLFRIDRHRWFEAKDAEAAAVRYLDGASDAEGGALLDLLHDSPPAFFSADLARLDGDVLAPAPIDYVPFDPARIEVIDWAAEKVDPLLEKGRGGAQRSLFEWVEARLVSGAADVIFNDDDTGEIADFVALYARGAGATLVELYHCKAAGRRPVPGKRVEDVYEVAGQAIKCMRIMRTGALRTHLLRRAAETVAGARRFVRGDRQTLERVLADRVVLSFEITIVQPGIGRTSGDAVNNVLAAANSYMAGGSARELRIIGA